MVDVVGRERLWIAVHASVAHGVGCVVRIEILNRSDLAHDGATAQDLHLHGMFAVCGRHVSVGHEPPLLDAKGGVPRHFKAALARHAVLACVERAAGVVESLVRLARLVRQAVVEQHLINVLLITAVAAVEADHESVVRRLGCAVNQHLAREHHVRESCATSNLDAVVESGHDGMHPAGPTVYGGVLLHVCDDIVDAIYVTPVEVLWDVRRYPVRVPAGEGDRRAASVPCAHHAREEGIPDEAVGAQRAAR
mmetsp:Transcript_23617/g.69564  ORF Transcript_23617/g.69564 Transcript_23617/m.69564 type:complete len:251 (+) Transcript_23617:596-1348(+)